jgi:hypothetical protein
MPMSTKEPGMGMGQPRDGGLRPKALAVPAAIADNVMREIE